MWLALSFGSNCAPPWLTCRHPRFWVMAVEWANRPSLNVAPCSHTERTATFTEMDPSAATHVLVGRAAKMAAYSLAVAGVFYAQDAGTDPATSVTWARLGGRG